MKKVFFQTVIVLAIAFGLTATASWTAGTADKGAYVYFCDCEEGCPCPSPYLEPGTCDCGLALAKGKVLRIDKEKDKIYLCKCDDDKCPCAFDPKDATKCGCNYKVKEYPLKGKYVCNCGPDCRCNTVSVNPGKCSCGVPMKKVE
ncbi:MAG: hypothetical protein HZA15_06955 [Nitrospirae bacterium]|nr:hypothetical protein [Nitrospirota bacterium]